MTGTWSVVILRYDDILSRNVIDSRTFYHRTAKAAARRLASIIGKKEWTLWHRFFILSPQGIRYSLRGLQAAIRQGQV